MTERTCRRCARFIGDAARIEALIPGLTAMGSARASVRSDDGICTTHDSIVTARDTCGMFTPRAEPAAERVDARTGTATSCRPASA
jgi:hypothetical protein